MTTTEQKVTDWFAVDVKPNLPGWYEREYSLLSLQKHCDFWDGERWFSGMHGKAEQRACIPRRWRGLATDPSKAG